FFFSSRRRHTRFSRDWSSDVCSSDLSAEETLGQVLRNDLSRYRDEMIISTKAGYNMWPGPYGEFGSKKHLISSLDQSLKRMGIEIGRTSCRESVESGGVEET